jgi:cobalt-precorrin 5A hydrolase
MGDREAMIGFLAIGIGCRKNCAGPVIADLIDRTIAALPKSEISPRKPMLFTIADKHDEVGIRQAAETLAIDLAFLPREALRQAMARTQTHSALAAALFGVASIAEAAALAGAGPKATLLVPRMSLNGATCAIAADLSAFRDSAS